MKQFSKSLCSFINLFHLETNEGCVYFNATVYTFLDRRKIVTESAIHIVTIPQKKIDVIYVLSPIDIENFPSYFVIGSCDISFNLQQGLKIKALPVPFSSQELFIQPLGKTYSLAEMVM